MTYQINKYGKINNHIMKKETFEKLYRLIFACHDCEKKKRIVTNFAQVNLKKGSCLFCNMDTINKVGITISDFRNLQIDKIIS